MLQITIDRTVLSTVLFSHEIHTVYKVLSIDENLTERGSSPMSLVNRKSRLRLA